MEMEEKVVSGVAMTFVFVFLTFTTFTHSFCCITRHIYDKNYLLQMLRYFLYRDVSNGLYLSWSRVEWCETSDDFMMRELWLSAVGRVDCL